MSVIFLQKSANIDLAPSICLLFSHAVYLHQLNLARKKKTVESYEIACFFRIRMHFWRWFIRKDCQRWYNTSTNVDIISLLEKQRNQLAHTKKQNDSKSSSVFFVYSQKKDEPSCFCQHSALTPFFLSNHQKIFYLFTYYKIRERVYSISKANRDLEREVEDGTQTGS